MRGGGHGLDPRVPGRPALIEVRPDLSRTQFARNIGANIAGLLVGLVASVPLTPYWIGKLGVAAYGLVPLTNNLVGYFAVITAVLSSSASRFITMEVGRGDYTRADRTFNTSLWVSAALATGIVAAGIVASFHLGVFIEIPSGLERDMQAMAVLATFTFALALVQAPFGAATFSANRLDLSTWAGVMARAIQVSVAVGLIATVYCSPVALMAASLAGAMVSLVAAIYYWRRFMPWSRLALSLDREALKAQASYGGWIVINTIGSLLYLQIDLVVINIILGPELGGRYAAVSQWSLLIRSLGAAMSTVFTPSILHFHARNDVEGIVRYARTSVLMLGLVLALPIGLIAGLAGPLLTCWLGTGYAGYEWLLLLMVLPLTVNVAVTPLFSVQMAANRIRTPALVTCFMGALNALLAVLLTQRWGLYGTAAAGAMMLTAKNVVFTPIYAAYVLKRPWVRSTFSFGKRSSMTLTAKNVVFTPIYAAYVLKRPWDSFLWSIAKTTMASLVVAATAMVVGMVLAPGSWIGLAAVGAGLGAVYIPIAWWTLLTAADRQQLTAAVLRPGWERLSGALRRRTPP